MEISCFQLNTKSICLNMGHAIELMFDICLEVGYC